MRKLYWNIAAIAMMAGGLAACGGSDNSVPAPPPVVVPPPAPKLEDQFGTNFGVDYRADMNTDAKDPAAGDLIPLSLVTEAVTI